MGFQEAFAVKKNKESLGDSESRWKKMAHESPIKMDG
jgi:hypothetical protein